MKNIILTIALFCSIKSFSQTNDLKVGERFIRINKDFKLKNDTVTIVEVGKSIVYYQGKDKKYVIFTKKKFFKEDYILLDSLGSK